MSNRTWQVHHPYEGTLLLLEDNDELAASLQEFLELYSCKTVRVTNGVDGLRKIMVVDFDVILCDMVMPAFPGDMFYRAVERVKPHLCRRFIFMTGHAGNARIDAFIRSVRGFMLWKPFQLHEVLDAIKTVLRKAASSGG